VARSEVAAGSEVARSRVGRSPPRENASVPAVKKKRGLGATFDGLEMKISQVEARVYGAATEVLSKKNHIVSLQNANALLQEKLGGEELRSAHALSQLNDERDAHNST
jgi:hypothetical protein